MRLNNVPPFKPWAVVMTQRLNGEPFAIPLEFLLHVVPLNALYTEVTYLSGDRAKTILVVTPPGISIPAQAAALLADMGYPYDNN